MGTETISVTRVMPDEIGSRMDRGELFTFVDSRNPKAWSEAKEKLPGAVRIHAEDVSKHVGDLPRDRTIITYCT